MVCFPKAKLATFQPPLSHDIDLMKVSHYKADQNQCWVNILPFQGQFIPDIPSVQKKMIITPCGSAQI